MLGPKATDEEIRQIQAAIRTELESAKKEKDTHDAWKDPAVAASQRDGALEDFISGARSAPVFGGTMDEDEKERLARVFSEENLTNDNWRRYGAEAQNCFFYLADLNSDGEKDVLFGIGQDLFMIRDNRVFTLYQGWVKNGGRGLPDNMLAISADEQRIIKNEWASLVINSKIYSLDPSDAEEIASADKTR